MRVPMLDLRAQHDRCGAACTRAVEQVVAEQHFILGPAVQRFEQAVQDYLPVQHAIGVSSGSDALVCALLSLGVGPGDEVIVPPFSFIATVESVIRVGARPVFADIEPLALALCPRAVANAMSSRTKAVMVVHLYGSPADLKSILEVTESRGVPLIEDAAQAFGARWKGRPLGAWGAAGCFSFQPTKPLAAWGDAGMVVTNDARVAEQCGRVRVHGATGKYLHVMTGGNYRLDAIQAAVLHEKLAHLPTWLEERRIHAREYTCDLADVAGLELPRVFEGSEPSHALYTVRVKEGRRAELQAYLAAAEISTAIHYPTTLHRQPALLELGLGMPEGVLPNAEQAAREVLSIPLYAELGADQRRYVVDSIRSFFRCSS